jgi:hypothetical protein
MSVSVAACPRNQLKIFDLKPIFYLECQPRDNLDAFKPTLFYNFFLILGLIACNRHQLQQGTHVMKLVLCARPAIV